MTDPIPTSEQSAAIDYSLSLVAIAKPGSGKTFVLSRKIKAILNQAATYSGVIAISYTNKASNELKARASRGGTDLKGSFFGTIDNFCFGEIVIPFLPHLWKKSAIEIGIDRIKDLPSEESDRFIGFNGHALSEVNLEENLDLLKSYYEKGVVFLEASGALALYILKKSSACRRYVTARFSHVFIDEYQDSGLEQHQLFLELHSLGLIGVAVGDIDQSIYGFSNKDSRYLQFLAKSPEFRTFPINYNHRCHPSITNYSLRFLDPNAVMLPAQELRVFEKRCVGTAADIAKWINSVLPQLTAGLIVKKMSDIGILVRSNKSAELVSSNLTSKHRHFVAHPLEDDFSLWSRLFCQLLAFRFNPSATVQDFVDGYSSSATRDVRAIRKAVKEVRSCEIGELQENMVRTAKILLPNAEKEAPLQLLKASSAVDLEAHFSPASDDEIQVMTLHKSKGLEFDLVFHLDLYEWVLPAKRPGENDDFDNPVYPSLEQDTNLHYVGVTRARKACFLCHSTNRYNNEGKRKNGAPSEFLNSEGLDLLRIHSTL